MSGSESSFDEFKVDFDDDINFAESGISSGIPDQGGGGTVAVPHSVTSPCASLINSGSTSSLDCGPNPSMTSNWVLGVRHLSFASNSLNERMAKRGKQFSNVLESNPNELKLNHSYVHKRDHKIALKYPPMEDIEEVSASAESFDTFHSHHINTNKNYQSNGSNRRQMTSTTERVINSGFKSSNKNSEKFVQTNHKPNAGLSTTGKPIKSTPIPSGSKSSPKIDSTNVNNGTNGTDNKINCGKRTKTTDKSINYSDYNKNITNLQSIKKEISNQIKTPNDLSTNYKRSVNLVTLSAEQELQRYKSQRFCETVSLITIIFGIILVTITPFLLIPIWVIPNPYSPMIRNFLWLSLLTSVILLSLAALTGNIYWFYDEKSQKWKWFYHCGKGPEDHYWGATLLHNHKPLKPLKKKNPNISINV